MGYDSLRSACNPLDWKGQPNDFLLRLLHVSRQRIPVCVHRVALQKIGSATVVESGSACIWSNGSLSPSAPAIPRSFSSPALMTMLRGSHWRFFGSENLTLKS